MASESHRWTLRAAPLSVRLVVAVFLLSVGIGYGSALVQLHFQHARAGAALPTPQDAEETFHGRPGMSELERLLMADDSRPFNSSGSMRHAFTIKSAGWKSAISRRAREKSLDKALAEQDLRAERDGERLALLDWVRNGADQKAYEEDHYPLPAALVGHPITDTFADTGEDGSPRVKIRSILETRCVRCHAEGASSGGGMIPLQSWEQVHDYCEAQPATGAMSVQKLAQTTHIHLLGFAMLYGMTGLIFACTGYPGWLRGLLAPLPLAAQVVDIGCWWLGRLDPFFARAVVFTGGVVALGLFLQITLSLFHLFGKTGKVALLLLFVGGGLGGYAVKEQVIEPYLTRERAIATPVPAPPDHSPSAHPNPETKP